MSHLTNAEIDALQETQLHRQTPFIIDGESFKHIKTASKFDGGYVRGNPYTHFPETDEFIRDDVVSWLTTHRQFAAENQAAA